MRKRYGLIISLVVIVIALALLVRFSSGDILNLAGKPVSGGAIGPGWEYRGSEDTDGGKKWVYTHGETEKLVIRIRDFNSSEEASRLYAETFASDKLNMQDFTGLGDNGFVGVYYDDFWLKGPWLVLITQEGKNYTELLYTNKVVKNKEIYGGDVDADAAWLIALAKKI